MVFQCCASTWRSRWLSLVNPTVESGELGINEFHLNTRVLSRVVGCNFMHNQLSRLVERQLLDSHCIEFDPLSISDQVISSYELECGYLVAIIEDSNSNRPQPAGVNCPNWAQSSGTKSAFIDLNVVIAQQVEDGAVLTLEAVAEQTSYLQVTRWQSVGQTLSQTQLNLYTRKCERDERVVSSQLSSTIIILF